MAQHDLARYINVSIHLSIYRRRCAGAQAGPPGRDHEPHGPEPRPGGRAHCHLVRHGRGSARDARAQRDPNPNSTPTPTPNATPTPTPTPNPTPNATPNQARSEAEAALLEQHTTHTSRLLGMQAEAEARLADREASHLRQLQAVTPTRTLAPTLSLIPSPSPT